MLSLLGSAYCFYSRWYTDYSSTLHFDSLFSQQARNEISTWFHQADSLFLQQRICKLQKKFTSVKSARYIYRPHSRAYDIFIGCHSPRIVWNSTSIITDQALVIPYDYFSVEYLKELPQITSEDCCRDIPAYLCSTLLSISPFLFQKYCIKVCNQNAILLCDNNQKEYAILVDKDSLSNVLKIEKAYQLFSTKNNKKSNNRKYMYDIRFNNQILEYVVKGKWNDEKQKGA